MSKFNYINPNNEDEIKERLLSLLLGILDRYAKVTFDELRETTLYTIEYTQEFKDVLTILIYSSDEIERRVGIILDMMAKYPQIYPHNLVASLNLELNDSYTRAVLSVLSFIHKTKPAGYDGDRTLASPDLPRLDISRQEVYYSTPMYLDCSEEE